MSLQLPAIDPDKYRAVWNNRLNRYELMDIATGDLLIQPPPIPERISVYCKQTVDILLARLRDGELLSNICKETDMPSYSAVYAWRARFPEFRGAMDLALEDRAEVFHDKVLAYGEKAILAERNERDGLKIAIDTCKWAAERGNRRRFGAPTPAEQGDRGFTIILNTGVLETPSPTNVVVDERGNFQGFIHGDENGMGTDRRGGTDGGRGHGAEIDDVAFQEAGGDSGARQGVVGEGEEGQGV